MIKASDGCWYRFLSVDQKNRKRLIKNYRYPSIYRTVFGYRFLPFEPAG